MSEAAPAGSAAEVRERLGKLAIKAYWAEVLGNEPLDSAVRMDAALEVVAQFLEELAPSPTAAPLTHRTMAFAANEIRGVYREHQQPPED
jgi:hypothetical protein